MTVAVVGSRDSRELTVEQVMAELPADCTAIVSGGAMGVDALAKEAADRLGLPFTECLPDYDTFGKMAPLQRNTTIVDQADMVIAFWDCRSAGTKDTLQKALRRDKKIKIVRIE